MPQTISGAGTHPSEPTATTAERSPPYGSSGASAGSAFVGIAWMLVTTFLFVCQDSLARLLLASYPAIELAFVRFAVHSVAVAALVALQDPRLAISRRPVTQLVRSALLLSATLLVMAALQLMPFVDVVAVVWVAPVLVTALSVVLLGEHVGLAGWLAVLAGLTGVWIIVGAAGIDLSWAMLVPLLAALANALYQIATRMLHGTDRPITTLLYTGVAGTIVCTLFLPFVALRPTISDAWLMALLGVLGTASHFCMIRAFSAAPASIVAPFGYASLVWSTLFGVMLFAEVPGPTTIAGSGLIVGSGLVVLLRGRKARRRAATEA
jgi:drug/metabolite transporter (DMT)-like permease